jgi:hypothetical protein
MPRLSGDVEKDAMRRLMPYMRGMLACHGQVVVTSRGIQSADLQLTYGDVLLNDAHEDVVAIEIKSEEENKYGKFFLETWANYDVTRKFRKLGWMYTLGCDELWYYFIKEDDLYIIEFPGLFHWAFGTPFEDKDGIGKSHGRLLDFPERRQRKRRQRNPSFGRPVPIDIIEKEVGFRHVRPYGEQTDMFPDLRILSQPPRYTNGAL